MANSGWKLKKIEMDHDGMDALLKSPEIQSALESTAASVISKTSSGYSYNADTSVLSTRAVTKIECGDYRTLNHNLKTNELVKLVKGGSA